jgi:2-oxoglutarate ferredoxin oxidoreductase subunit beta
VHKAVMKSLEKMGHDPTDRLRAMALAQEYGTQLYTGIFYQNSTPAPRYNDLVRERVKELRPAARPKEKLLEMFRPD